MKQKLFKQSNEGPEDLTFATTKPRFSINIDAKKIGKKFSVFFLATIAITGLMIGLLMALNSFFNSHYFEFRSPVIFQQPILLHKRDLITPLPEALSLKVEAQAPTPTPEPELVLSAKAEGCIENYPEVAEKLVDAFPTEPAAIIELVCRESSLNPRAVNKSSGAAGLFQAYPASKLKCDLSDVDCQIAWGKAYIEQRYGTAKAALLFHDEQKAKCLRNNPSNKKCEGWY